MLRIWRIPGSIDLLSLSETQYQMCVLMTVYLEQSRFNFVCLQHSRSLVDSGSNDQSFSVKTGARNRIEHLG